MSNPFDLKTPLPGEDLSDLRTALEKVRPGILPPLSGTVLLASDGPTASEPPSVVFTPFSVELVSHTKDAQQIIELCGHTCYKSEDKIIPPGGNHIFLGNAGPAHSANQVFTCKHCGIEESKAPVLCPGTAPRFVRMVIARGHESVLEHASASIRFTVDRGVSHELVRHRLVSFSQESTRFCNYSTTKFGGGIEVSPMLDGLTHEQQTRRFELYQHCQEVYLAEIAEGVKPQQARDNLPTCLKTEIVFTCNLREWRTVFKQRLPPAAHPQMRKAMHMAFGHLRSVAPDIFADVTVSL